MKDFLQQVKEDRCNRIAIMLHKNADPDAVGGGFALYSLIKKICPDIEVKICGDEVSLVSKKIIEKLKIPFLEDLKDFNPDCLLLFDLNSPELLGKHRDLLNSSRLVYLIDHHHQSEAVKDLTSWSFVDAGSPSASELVYRLYEELDVPLDLVVAEAILVGMVSDSRHFLLANENTFEVAAALLKLKVPYAEIVELLKFDMDRPEKLARLKAAQRMKIHQIHGKTVVFSQVSSYDASACRALLGLGADAVFIFLKRKNEVRISARSTYSFSKETGIHLGRDIMEPLGPLIDGSGGGHENAAGCNGKKNLVEAKNFIINYLKSAISPLEEE
ncbi:MAG: DHH family phosphoesterase [Candidatus Helarchaeota archaeon]